MGKNKKEVVKSLEVLAKEEIHTWDLGEGMIAATIHIPDSEPKEFRFPEGKSSTEIVQHSTSGSSIQGKYQEDLIEILDRGRAFSEFDIKVKIGFVEVSFSKKPKREEKITTRIIS
jgi:hypothetical protein